MTRTLPFVIALGFALGLAGAAPADPLDLFYTKSSIGGGLLQYDFTLKVTNLDSSYAPGQGWNWIIFGDVPSSTSTLPDFSLSWETFPNPNMGFSSSGGGHNGPTFIDTVNLGTDGWIPLGVGDFVQWSGTSAFDVPDGSLLFSSLIPLFGATPPDFKPAIPTAVPEPSFVLLVGGLILAADQGRRRLARSKRPMRKARQSRPTPSASS